jgi:hypothetical protein
VKLTTHLPQYVFMTWFLVKQRENLPLCIIRRNQDSSVVQRGATCWMIRGSSAGRGWEFFSSTPPPDRHWGPLSLQSNGYKESFLGVKRPGRETDHSSPSSAEVKNAWSYTSTPPIRLHCVVLKEKLMVPMTSSPRSCATISTTV